MTFNLQGNGKLRRRLKFFFVYTATLFIFACSNPLGTGSVQTAFHPGIPINPALNLIGNRLFPSDFLAQETSAQYVFNLTSGSAVGGVFGCTFDQVVDGQVSGGLNCTALPGTALFDPTTGIFSWTPNIEAIGAFEIQATYSSANMALLSEIFIVDVRQNFTTTHLLANFDANFANGFAPSSPADQQWKDITTNDFLLSFGAGMSESGSGSRDSPYALSFSSLNTGASVTASVLQGQTHLMFDTWLNQTSPQTPDQVIFSNNNDGSGNGFSLKQSRSQPGKIELSIGRSYEDVILADRPVAYWRLGESSGLTAKDISGSGQDGTYQNSPTLGEIGATSADIDTSVSFNDPSQSVLLADSTKDSFERNQPFSLEVWTNTSNQASFQVPIAKMLNAPPYNGYDLYISPSGAVGLQIIHSYPDNIIQVATTSTGPVNDGNWHHLVAIYDGSSTAGGIKIYIDGVQATLSIDYDSLSLSSNTNAVLSLAVRAGEGDPFVGRLDEAAIYDYALSQNQVTTHYNAGLGLSGASCRTNSTFSGNTWNNVAAILDGSLVHLFVNGNQECQISYSDVAFGASNLNVILGNVGNGGKSWQGKIASLKFYGTNDGTPVGTSASLKANFNATTNGFP